MEFFLRKLNDNDTIFKIAILGKLKKFDGFDISKRWVTIRSFKQKEDFLNNKTLVKTCRVKENCIYLLSLPEPWFNGENFSEYWYVEIMSEEMAIFTKLQNENVIVLKS